MQSKQRRMGYEAPERSAAGDWKFSRDGRELPENRSISRAFGAALAASGLMKGERRDWVKITRFAMAPENRNAYSRMFYYSSLTLMGVLQPGLAKSIDTAEDPAWERPSWMGETWFLDSPYRVIHGLHISEEDPSQIAFAENVGKLLAKKYTRCKPGRYLTRFFGDVLSEDQIRRYTERFAARLLDAELHFIENTDPEGWVRIYKDGPASCMHGEDCVKVYAYPGNGLRLAYMQRGEEIVARCIVQEEDKTYVRAYPNCHSDELTKMHNYMRAKLEAEGYTYGPDLDGVKLRAIEEGDYGCYVMPYIDGRTQNVEFHGSYFMVSRRGEYEANNTDGTIRLEPEATCDRCDDGMSEDDATYIERDDQSVCSDCLNRHYVEAIGRRGWGDWSQTNDTVYCETDGQHYVTDYASNNEVYECEDSGLYYKMDDLCATKEGLFHTGLCVALDVEDSEGNSMAHRDNVATTHDGRTIHEDDVVEHGGLDYHKDDDLPEDEDEMSVQVPYTGTHPGEVDTHTLPLPLESEPGVNG